jgi:hypothetical protein
VFRKLGLLAGLAGVLAPWALAQSQSSDAQAPAKTQTQAQEQEQPSLADAARQARLNKDKNTAPAKKILTDEDVATSHSAGGVATLGGHSNSVSSSSHAASRAGANDNSSMGQAWAGIGRAEDSLDQLAPLDRASLAKVVLDSNDVDFQGRSTWEDKLFIAKERYVSESRQLVDEMKSVMANAQSFQDPSGSSKAGSDSPQAQELVARAQRLLAQAKNTESNFKAVMQEGIDQAKLAARH